MTGRADNIEPRYKTLQELERAEGKNPHKQNEYFKVRNEFLLEKYRELEQKRSTAKEEELEEIDQELGKINEYGKNNIKLWHSAVLRSFDIDQTRLEPFSPEQIQQFTESKNENVQRAYIEYRAAKKAVNDYIKIYINALESADSVKIEQAKSQVLNALDFLRTKTAQMYREQAAVRLNKAMPDVMESIDRLLKEENARQMDINSRNQLAMIAGSIKTLSQYDSNIENYVRLERERLDTSMANIEAILNIPLSMVEEPEPERIDLSHEDRLELIVGRIHDAYDTYNKKLSSRDQFEEEKEEIADDLEELYADGAEIPDKIWKAVGRKPPVPENEPMPEPVKPMQSNENPATQGMEFDNKSPNYIAFIVPLQELTKELKIFISSTTSSLEQIKDTPDEAEELTAMRDQLPSELKGMRSRLEELSEKLNKEIAAPDISEKTTQELIHVQTQLSKIAEQFDTAEKQVESELKVGNFASDKGKEARTAASEESVPNSHTRLAS